MIKENLENKISMYKIEGLNFVCDFYVQVTQMKYLYCAVFLFK